MTMHTQANLLKKLREAIEAGDLTPTDKVGPGTFVCLTQITVLGIAYHQGHFEDFALDMRMVLEGATKGAKFGPIKVVAIFHAWPEAKKKSSPPVQAFDN